MKSTNTYDILQVAIGKREKLTIYGTDFDTVDGTAVRDYVHVMDVADAHVRAMDLVFKKDFAGWKAYNLGNGRGTSVLEVSHVPFHVVKGLEWCHIGLVCTGCQGI